MKPSIAAISSLLALFVARNAEAATALDPTVKCDPAMPAICRGSLEVFTPSPAQIDDEVFYIGGYDWFYSFVRGLPDGYVDTYSGYPSDYGIYNYGPSVHLRMEDDQKTCSVTVGNETCSSCQLCGWEADKQTYSFSANCTNVQTQDYLPDVGAGKLMECTPILPFFYPLEIPADLPDLPPPAAANASLP